MARRSTPRLAPEERREQILDVTLRLGARGGFHTMSIDAIAKAAGITRPVVYSLFGDLAGLLNALADREEARALAQLREAIPDSPGPQDDPDTLLVEGIRAYLEAVQAAPDTWRVVLMPPEGTPAVMRQRTERERARVLERLEGLMAWGVERRKGLDVADNELMARMLIVIAEDAARLTLTHPRRYPVERMVTFVRQALAALPEEAA